MKSNLTADGQERGRVIGNAKQAHQSVQDNWDLLPDLFRMRAHGASLRDCAANLNDRGVRTRKGTDWSAVQVKRLLDRVHGQIEFTIQRLTGSGWADYKNGFSSYMEAEEAMGELDRGREYRIEVYSK
jgi:hypothetical protein